MKKIFLEDLKDMDEKGVKLHLSKQYGEKEYYEDEEKDENLFNQLKEYDVLIAYESVGSWGCDSSSFFLLRKKSSGRLFEVNGSHCSCYGFENQFKPTPVNKIELKNRAKEEYGLFYPGGYDNSPSNNISSIKHYVLNEL